MKDIWRAVRQATGAGARDDIAKTENSPLDSASTSHARESGRTNPHNTWAARTFQANQADPTLACHRIWKDLPELHVAPKFKVDRSIAVFASGSCFAREVEDALVDLGFPVATHCDALFHSAPLMHEGHLNPGARPRAYLNRYNSMSMLDEFRHLLGAAPELEKGLLTYALDRGSAADLHYTQSLRQVDSSTTLQRRQRVREHLGPLVRQCKLFVITLGMAECWYDAAADRYLNNTPGPRVMAAYGDRLAVHLTRFDQHRQALQDLHALLSSVHGDDFRLVITVSPVPLERTFLAQDVITTNSYSKSMLRAVAQEFACSHANVDYFPSYELVNYAAPQTAWAWDYRHVTPELVGHIMSLFKTHYVA
ncbi:GSCFA domain-containing protein [Ideonella sp. DXS29W]|uniref:GSCFA domain-containing protein n=1 Tax=Ideonella lacteola TaxID=2984193 RepID=A0ABU9BMI0_9BURK